MADVIAVVNAGSSSLKLSLYDVDAGRPVLRERRQIANAAGTHAALRTLQFLRDRAGGDSLLGVGHRVVHGGRQFAQPVPVDEDVLAALERLVPLAPLHQPHNLAPIRAIAREAPELLQVACFDTAFHRTQPAVARMFALPPAFAERGIERYGFHGLSYEYVASVMPLMDAKAARGNVVVAHLGNGASMCAMRDCRSMATTMGFSTLDGLVMGTRGGLLDPGVILHLLREGMDAASIERMLYHESGLLGVSGLSSDMRSLLESSDPRAAFAVALFGYRMNRELGSLVAALGGLDALVFTGGIGENAAPVRAAVIEAAPWLGLALDASANDRHAQRITTPASRIPAYVVATDEGSIIARRVMALRRPLQT
ncbi:MAG TPA: acetate/propionate family kinase [Casimicrobiaceae bacterium]|nr:acetate/propionate family kinase [Casimicrobiaceae bacterium]